MLGSPSTALEFFLSKATARQHQRTAQQAPPAQALQACDQPPAAAAAGAAQWGAADTEGLTSMEANALSLETACDRDGGLCNAAMVRAVERAQVCGAAARLYDHRQDVLDTSPIRCTRATTDGGKP